MNDTIVVRKNLKLPEIRQFQGFSKKEIFQGKNWW